MSKMYRSFSEAKAICAKLKEKGQKCYIQEYFNENGAFYSILIF